MLKKYVFGFFLVASGLLSAVHPLPTHAQEPPQVIISEINWAGSALSSADEWIELYNAGSEDTDASGWVLAGAATGGEALAIATGTTIRAGEPLLISNYGLGEKSTLAVPPNLVTTSLSLPNTGLHIILALPDGTVIDEANFGGTHKVGSAAPLASAERNWQTLEWQTAELSSGLTDLAQLGSPGAATQTAPIEIAAEPAAEVIITEIETTEVVAPADAIAEITITEPEVAVLESIIEEIAPSSIVEEVTPVETVVESIEVIAATEVIETIGEPTPETSIASEAEVAPVETVVESVDGGVTAEEETSVSIEPVESEVLAVDEVTTEMVPEMIAAEPVETPIEIITEEPIATVTVPTTEVLAETTTASFVSGTVVISELVSDPVDGAEWIELYNPGDDAIDLSAWSITDAADKKTTLEGSIEVQGLFIVNNPKGKLNNSGDEVNLYDPAGNLIDQVAYGTNKVPVAKKGQSLSLVDGTWTVTTASPGQTNPASISTPTYEEPTNDNITATGAPENQSPILSDDQSESTGDDDDQAVAAAQTNRVIALAAPASTPSSTKSIKKTSSVSKASTNTTASGVVTALPGTFGEQIMMIDGVQVYFYDHDWPTLALGDQVTVRGVRSENRGEPRIKIQNASDIRVTGTGSSAPTKLDLSALEQTHEGQLIIIEGDIQEINGNQLTVTEDGQTAKVIAYEKTGVSWSKLDGSRVRITGVVRLIEGVARIYPRFQADVEVIHDEIVTSTLSSDQNISRASDWPTYLAYGLLLGTLSALGYWFVKRNNSSALKINTAINH